VSVPKLREGEYRLLRELINELSGIMLADDFLATVERKLGERVSALGLSDFHEYYRYLRHHPQRKAEIERALETITTNETYFFRELPQLQAFETEVLPQLRAAGDARRTLNVWSAGCSTGEEVYTLAILIHKSGLFADWEVRVFGNDISRRVLQVARRGLYREASFRALPPAYEEYFVQEEQGRSVVPEVRDLCQFGHFSLFDEARVAMLGRVDAIFCRNVLIYFDAMSRSRLIQLFYERLLPGGYLMLGHSESLLHTTTAFELAHLRSDIAYRKPLRSESGSERGRHT
jgi:chemotaxis protein methyltransferase CheR